MTTFCVSPYPPVPTPMPEGWNPGDEDKTRTKTPYPKEPIPKPEPDKEHLKELDSMWKYGRNIFSSDSDYISYLKEYVIQLRRSNQHPQTSEK